MRAGAPNSGPIQSRPCRSWRRSCNTRCATAADVRRQDVPRSVQLRWRSGEHQAALTSWCCKRRPTIWAATCRSSAPPGGAGWPFETRRGSSRSADRLTEPPSAPYDRYKLPDENQVIPGRPNNPALKIDGRDSAEFRPILTSLHTDHSPVWRTPPRRKMDSWVSSRPLHHDQLVGGPGRDRCIGGEQRRQCEVRR